MIKKRILGVSAAAMALCLVGACGKNESAPTIQAQTEENVQEESSEINETEDTQVNPTSIDLTEQAEQSTTVDPIIEPYENVQQFGYNLLTQNIHDKNPVLSPVSAYLALSMAGCGADGTTKDEFFSVLGNNMMDLSDDMMNTFPANGDSLKLSISNSAWIDDEFTVNDEWMSTIQSLMDAEAFHADLSTVETMNSINNWIHDKTNGLIDKMLGEPLNDLTRLALINTVYFKGKWEITFEATDTHKEDFYLDKEQGATEQVDMMNLYRTDLEYISNDFAEGVVLPYQNIGDGGKLAFIALKPTGDNDIRDLYSSLTNKVMNDMLVNKQTELVDLKLPKFEVTFDKELNESLENMGLTECFDMDKANFDQVGKTQSGDNLYIGTVRQKAKIIVDEEGTEAAAVTEVLMMCGASMEPEEPREVYFNEPFVYMIMDMDKEIPLFIGILDNPNAIE